MQGTAAEFIKRAMIAVDQWLVEESIDAKLIMQVHDELVLEVSDKIIDNVIDKITALMSSAAELKTPLLFDVGVGKNWDEAYLQNMHEYIS